MGVMRAESVLKLHALGMFGGVGRVFELVLFNSVANTLYLSCELVVTLAVVSGIALCLNIVEIASIQS